jgi:DNA repair protein SbcC/Rad50
MIIEQIKLKGFLSYIDETVDFRLPNISDNRILLISGPNGEGKSALLESIPFCYWATGRGKKLSDYINDKCDFVRVEVITISENVRYKKIRQYGASNVNELYVDKNNKSLNEANWKLISDDTKKKTDDLWSSIIGLDYNLFSNSVFFGQKEASSFIDGEASDRKELLCNLLGIQIYEQAEEETKNRIRDIESKLQSKQVVINDKNRIIEQKDTIKQLNSTVAKQIKSVNTDIEKLQDNLEQYRTKREQLKVEEANYNSNKEKLSDINEQISKSNVTKEQLTTDLESINTDIDQIIDEGINKIENLQKIIDNEQELLSSKEKYENKLKDINIEKLKIPSIKTKLEVQRNERDNFLQKKTEITTILTSLKEKKKKIEKSGAICPVIEEPCDKLSKENKEKMIKDVSHEIDITEGKQEKLQIEFESTREKIVELNGALDVISKRIEREPAIASSLTVVINDLAQVKIAQEEMPKMKIKYRAKVDKLTESKDKYEKKLKDINEEYVVLIAKKEKLTVKVKTDFVEEISKADRQIKVCNEDIKELTEQKNSYLAKIGRLKSELEQIELAEADRNKIQKEVDELNVDIRVYTELNVAFGKNGIQKDIIVNNVPILEEKTNELLSLFTKNNHLIVKFDLDPVTSSGKAKKRGGLDIIIYQNGQTPRSLNMYSGGETVRIVFAILLSLSYLLTKRAGKNSQTLIIDERVAALDAEGINQFIDVVKLISSQYKKILIVSHISELKEVFTNEFVVKKDVEHGSRVFN